MTTPRGWYNKQLLPLARDAKVAYVMVWQTHVGPEPDEYPHYDVPFPGHPEAEGFRRFHADPATCFLGDRCGLSRAAP